MANTVTVEHHIRIYDDQHGWYVTVRPDRDGGGACEISYNDGETSPKDETIIVLPWPMAKIMAQAILGMAEPEVHDNG